MDYFAGRFLEHMDGRLANIEAKLVSIIEKENEMSQALDQLTQQVAETKAVEESAMVLIEGISVRLSALADELAAAGIDNEKVLALAADLDASEQALAAAVAAVPPTA